MEMIIESMWPTLDEAEKLAKEDGYEGDFKKMRDVLDTWFSSSLWPFSTLDWTPEYPENTERLKSLSPHRCAGYWF